MIQFLDAKSFDRLGQKFYFFLSLQDSAISFTIDEHFEAPLIYWLHLQLGQSDLLPRTRVRIGKSKEERGSIEREGVERENRVERERTE